MIPQRGMTASENTSAIHFLTKERCWPKFVSLFLVFWYYMLW